MAEIVVQKFGGTSVDRDEHRRLAARKVMAAREAGMRPVVVVSAIGRRGAPYATDTLRDCLNGIDPSFTPNLREMDVMMACGELISTAVMAVTLQSMGVPAVALSGGQAGIETDTSFGSARILGVTPQAILDAVERNEVPVVCGFQGVTKCGGLAPHGDITTLGRGGSDTTASALGAALHAARVEIFTDVDGVKTADPDMVPNAATLDVCTYPELFEITHLGAQVVHPRAAEIAMDYGIPLWVKSTFSDHPGTCIVPDGDEPSATRSRVTGITHSGRGVFFRIQIDNEAHKPQIEQEVYRLMGRAGINMYMVSFSENSLSFAVNRDLYHRAQDLLDGMVVPIGSNPNNQPASHFYIFKFAKGLDLAYSAQRPLLRPVESFIEVVDVPGEVFENVTMVSVVASGHRHTPGVMSAIFKTLDAAGIPIIQVADSTMSISCLVPEANLEQAVRLLHDAFGLSGTQA
ncbi:MAG: aspartate kinase [Armatimonadetes bacterium]|nr:aspartate kinase [Armatimonadota bacterium]